jgi:hypothetical protein
MNPGSLEVRINFGGLGSNRYTATDWAGDTP